MLLTELNGHPIDKLSLYIEDNNGDSLVAKTQYYYIDEHSNVWLMLVITDEDGSKLSYWKKYSIDNRTAKLNLVDEINCEQNASINKENKAYCQ